jgi:hypothetical protein
MAIRNGAPVTGNREQGTGNREQHYSLFPLTLEPRLLYMSRDQAFTQRHYV